MPGVMLMSAQGMPPGPSEAPWWPAGLCVERAVGRKGGGELMK
jgi:hypothetical protein